MSLPEFQLMPQDPNEEARLPIGESGPPIPPSNTPPVDPIVENLDFAWVDVAMRLGYTIVAVRVKKGEKLWIQTLFSEELGKQLSLARLGQFNSIAWLPNEDFCVSFFYLRRDKRAGFKLIRALLEQRELLPVSCITFMDADGAWHLFKAT